MSNIEIQLKPVDAVAAGTIAWGASDELADLKGKASGMLLKEMDKVGGRGQRLHARHELLGARAHLRWQHFFFRAGWAIT